MSVAENPVREQLPSNAQQRFAVSSTIGAVVLLAALGFLFSALPMLWTVFWEGYLVSTLGFERNEFLAGAILILIALLVIGGLVYGAYGMLQSQTQPGVRAGMVVAAILIFLSSWLGLFLGLLLEKQFDDNPAVGWGVVVLITGALIAGIVYLYMAVPWWMAFLEALEEQGWFHGVSYKGNQGVRVRRGTILGVLVIGGCGIYTMATHYMFGTERSPSNEWFWILNVGDTITVVAATNDWSWIVPFTDRTMAIPLMFRLHIMMPLVLCFVLVWFAWRLVNVPGFTDFLIATEAEMNKVSWTSRRRLVQDTIVVLVTVVFVTGFLFVVDLLWIQLLSAPGIQVLLLNPRAEAQKQQEKAQW